MIGRDMMLSEPHHWQNLMMRKAPTTQGERLPALDEAWQSNEEITQTRLDAEDAVMQAQPRTHAGAVALLVSAAEYWERKDIEDYPDIPAAMVTAARAIADDPSKVVISDKLAASLEGWLKPWQEIRA
jgi:hypothetical protein